METIEVTAIDTRLEHTRQRDVEVERRLLSSIIERDIVDPLEVAPCESGHCYVLLDGFKRYRCARKLDKGMVPVRCIGEDVADGVLSFLRREETSSLSTLEQASLLKELHERYGLSIGDIALRLGRSPSWVSLRLNMVEGISDLIRSKIMSGAFPARAYMYGLKNFTRVNKIPSDRVDEFVSAVSGKGLSTRQLFVLWSAFFKGGPAIERLVLEGDVHTALRIITDNGAESSLSTLDAPLRRLMDDIKTVAIFMQHIIINAGSISISASEVNHTINFWSYRILACLQDFSTTIKELHDRTRPSGGSTDIIQSGSEPQSDSSAVTH